MDALAFMAYQDREHEAWLVVVAELRSRGVGELEPGEKDERLHAAIVRWGEELAQLRIADPDPNHATTALRERREQWEAAHE